MKNYYELLGVSVDAPNEVIKAAYRALSKKYHPDVCTDISNAGELMQQINVAYDTLSDPQKREQYDRELDLKKADGNADRYQSDISESEKGKMSGESNNGCSSCSCLFVIILIIAAVIFVPKIFNNSKNINVSNEHNKTITEDSVSNNTYSDPSMPEYYISDYLAKAKQDQEVLYNDFSSELIEEMKTCVADMESSDLVTDSANEFYSDKFVEIYRDFSYQVHSAVYESEDVAHVKVEIQYTGFPELLSDACKKCIELTDKLVRLDREVDVYTVYKNLNKTIDDLYPEYKNKKNQEITFVIVRKDQQWIVQSCSDTKALFNALFAGIFEEFSLE